MEFNERLDKIWDRISDEDFLANRGVANEVRYYVFDYEPCDELIIREKIKVLKKQNNSDADGFQIVEYDLYEMVIQILVCILDEKVFHPWVREKLHRH